MGGIKSTHKIELNEGQMDWLSEMVSQYELEDENKALRILVDFAMQDADPDTIFGEVRCNHCE